jgi:hypothetical protein
MGHISLEEFGLVAQDIELHFFLLKLGAERIDFCFDLVCALFGHFFVDQRIFQVNFVLLLGS